MRLRPILLAAALLCCRFACAQQHDAVPRFELTDSNRIPQTTIVPVLQPPVHLVDTVAMSEPERGMTRAERRAYRARRFAERIDSLVQSRDYTFRPRTMQELPDGRVHNVWADFYLFGLYVDHVAVHLPVERGATQYVELLGFDSMNLKDYAAVKMQSGWNVRLRVLDGEAVYIVDLVVSNITGEAKLTLQTPFNCMRYTGVLVE